ncbi:kynurenine formamidase [Mesocricetibacter intestinalis]|uniref:Kynurenine formamidase n=1 Tax=Mesocricetibacter intestinalis TaxID=1521930 RepID=A0A4R6VB42_9PAST|nr:cyclase family protein [Mesocricetibacter intestinalis]TDQ59387.1 kynurenine formamidase [Mesocricetibacter intestinalis]
MNYQLLSYPLDIADPGFPGEPTLSIQKSTRIADGDMYNSSIVHLFNHFGTHFDAPNHFNPKGATISELPLQRFIYERPLLLDIPKSAGEMIQPIDLEIHLSAIRRADFLMIRTGLEKLRMQHPNQYATKGVAVSVQTARYLMEHAANLKALGFDFISLASPDHPEQGIKSHQIMLGMFSHHFICIIEDMKLSAVDKTRLKRIFAMPLLIRGIDSAQVCILAESE